jgi:hypothetical protein
MEEQVRYPGTFWIWLFAVLAERKPKVGKTWRQNRITAAREQSRAEREEDIQAGPGRAEMKNIMVPNWAIGLWVAYLAYGWFGKWANGGAGPARGGREGGRGQEWRSEG